MTNKLSYCFSIASVKTKIGYSLLELIIAFALFALLMLISSPYLLGVYEKQKIVKELNKLEEVFKTAQQYSAIVREGSNYAVEFEIVDGKVVGYTMSALSPSVDFSDSVYLSENVVLTSVNLNEVVFEKLTGHLDDTEERSFSLQYLKYVAYITINFNGVVSVTDPMPI